MLAPATAAAQSPKAGAAVRIDFRALTEEGQQVADLKPEDVSLKVNGRQRQIQSLSLVQGSVEPSSGGSTLPPPFSSNAVGRGSRNIHILIDDDSISPGRESQVKDAIRLLASEMAPGDRLGVLTTQGQLNMRPVEDLTKVRMAVDNLTGHAPTVEPESEAQCRTTRLLAAFGSMLAVSSEPTTIVIFSGGISPPAVKQLQLGARTRTPLGGSQASSNGVNDMCPIEPDTFSNLGMLASTAHVDIYLFHLTEAMANRTSAMDAGFESLAGVTNAEFVRLTASPQSAISRLLRETAAYYTASFDADAGERGQSLRLELHATRDKVRLRSRPSVAIPKGDVAKSGTSPKDMLRTAAEYRELPLRATAYTSRMPSSEELRVVTLFEGVEAGAITAASVGLFDEKNTLKKQWTAQKDDLSKHPVRADLQAPPGVYRVRVAAVDASGRSGTTDYDLNADVVRADPLKLSALVIGTQQQGAGFVPRLQFTNESVAIGLVEIYGVPKGANVSVDLDVAATPQGEPLATAPTQLGNGSAEDARLAMGGFSIASLPPGDYLMRATVSLDGKPVGKVVRTLRKTQ
jgi:hypothetical protein